MPAQRAVLRLSLRCSNACVFCAQHGVTESRAVDMRAQLDELRKVTNEVTFVGGEPTLAKDLIDHVRAAGQAGFSRIGVQTNGHALQQLAPALADAGLTDVQTTVLGASPDAHDYHTATSGSFLALEKGIAACQQAGLTVLATTVLCRSNFRVLDDIHPLLRGWNVAAWLLQTTHTAGRAVTHFDRVVPRLGLALPYALHAVVTARAAGLPSWIRGAPLCMLGPHADKTMPTNQARAFATVCNGCVAKPLCAGIDDVYLRRFSEQELKTLSDAPPACDDHQPWSPMFVGTGDMALPPPELVVHPSPQDARKHLPVLAKARPAEQEVTRGSDKKSGDDLVEIFPDLLETETK